MSEYDREHTLQIKLNEFFVQGLELPECDYYSRLSVSEVLALKGILSDINNIMTMKLTLSFIDWLSVALNLDDAAKAEARSIVLSSKPSANGYDSWLGYPVSYVAEVKCNVPINGGSVYGSAQRHGVEKDLDGLLHGKRKAGLNPEKCLKFLVFYDSSAVRSANRHLASVNNLFRDKVVFVEPYVALDRTDIVYGVYAK